MIETPPPSHELRHDDEKQSFRRWGTDVPAGPYIQRRPYTYTFIYILAYAYAHIRIYMYI